MLKGKNKREIREHLQRAGVHATTQRVELAHYILHNFNHITADEINRLINSDFARVSRATIYNTLNLFVEIGLLKKLDIAGGSAIYDVNTEPHHHVVNEATGDLIDIHLPSEVEAGILSALAANFRGDQALRFNDLRIVVQARPAPASE